MDPGEQIRELVELVEPDTPGTDGHFNATGRDQLHESCQGDQLGLRSEPAGNNSSTVSKSRCCPIADERQLLFALLGDVGTC